MIKATILNKKYQIFNNWSDVTIRKMGKAQKYIDGMPLDVKNYIYSNEEEKEPVSDSRLLKFFIDWIEIFSTIPRKFLESEISVNNHDELSITELFGLVSKFLGEPSIDDIGESNTIKLKGKEYHLIESVYTAAGTEKMLGGATFKHYAESQAFARLFQDKKYRKWDYLSRITAILFREKKEEAYEEEIIDVRANLFKDLPVSEAYRGYFFLLSLQSKLQKSMLTSLNRKKQVKRSAQLVKRYYKTFIGMMLRIRLRVKTFITSLIKRP